jgi:hypothetical protein
MTCKINKAPQNGPPAGLISCINHLGNLLKNLPGNLPLDPPQSESCYSFGLEMELVEEEGFWFTFNRNLEVCFETHKIPVGGSIVFREQGWCCEALVKMFKEAVKALTKDADHEFLREVWLERLIKAAECRDQRCQRSEQHFLYKNCRTGLNTTLGDINGLLLMTQQKYSLRNTSDPKRLAPQKHRAQLMPWRVTRMMISLWMRCHWPTKGVSLSNWS